MRQGYDGTIRIDTKLDSAGLNKGAAEVSKKLTGIGKAVQGIGKGLAAVGKIAAVGLVAVLVAAVAVIGLLVRAIFAIGKATLSASKQALEYSKRVDEVKQTFARLKSALLDAFRPLIYFAIPWVNQVANSLIRILEMVAHVTAYITGQSGYWRTVTANVAAAGEAAKGSLASFDKLNVLQQDQGAGGAGGSSGQEWVEIGEELPDFLEGGWASFVEGLRSVLLEGDWSDLETWFQEYVWNPIVNSVGLEDGSSLKDLLLNFVDPRKLFDGDPNKPWGDWWKEQLDPRNWFAPTEGSKVGEIIDGIWDALWTGILEWKWDPLGELIIDGIFGANAWKFLTDGDYFKEWRDGWWAGIKEGISGGAGNIWEWIKEHVFQPVIDAVKGLFGISSPSTVMAEIGGQLIDGLKEGIKDAWTDITTWFNTTILVPLKAWFNGAWENIKIGATTAWENIKLVWNVVTGWFDENVIQPVVEFFKELWEKVSGFFVNLWADIVAIWNIVSDWFDENVIQPVVEFFKELWEDVSGFFIELWADIQGVWSVVAGWFDENVIQPVVEFFKELWEDVSGYFVDLWEGIKNVWNDVAGWFKDNVINPIIGFINGLIGVVETAINWIVDGLNKISFDITAWLGGGTFGINLTPVGFGRIPELAKGAVIPPNSEFLAILGDQKSGRNIETPENLLRQIMREEMRGMNSQPQTIHNVLKLDGRVLYESWDKENRRVGPSMVTKGSMS